MPTRPRPFWPVLCLAAFLALLSVVIGDCEPVRHADAAISEWFREYGTDNRRAIEVIRVVTDVMGTYAFLTIGAAATALLWRTRRRAAVLCATVTVAVPVLWSLMHVLLHRPRPVGGFVAIASNGFPSGHTSHATATAVTALLLLWPRLRPAWRAVAVAVGAGFAVAIGLTRVALLAHWPTDALGGWLLGLSVVPLLALLIFPDTTRAPGGRQAQRVSS